MQVSFDRDVVISQNNEYEILQLMMGDCRDRLSNYPGTPPPPHPFPPRYLLLINMILVAIAP
jgi:hypothetical protein